MYTSIDILALTFSSSLDTSILTFNEQVYFAVFGSIFPSEICIHECYDLKGTSIGRAENKVTVQERPLHKDLDFDLCFYVDPLVRARLLA